MGRTYKQLCLEERCEIARLSAGGSSIRQIAAALDRPPSTISRELNRNSGVQVGYKPSYAQQQMRARRWTGSRLEREPGLRRAVLERLGRGWSPEQVADRKTPGHWEADLMMFSKYGQQILAVHERTSRLLLGVPLASKLASGVAHHLVRLFEVLPQPIRRTVTFDNGTEFAAHLSLQSLLIKTFFCDPHAPWQKGGIENAIGRMRRFIPRNTDLEKLPPRRLRKSIAAYNNTPRKCLDFKTPTEVFAAQVLHFECESTSRPSPGRRGWFYPAPRFTPAAFSHS